MSAACQCPLSALITALLIQIGCRTVRIICRAVVRVRSQREKRSRGEEVNVFDSKIVLALMSGSTASGMPLL